MMSEVLAPPLPRQCKVDHVCEGGRVDIPGWDQVSEPGNERGRGCGSSTPGQLQPGSANIRKGKTVRTSGRAAPQAVIQLLNLVS